MPDKPENTPSEIGRPTAYDPAFVAQAEKLCRLGATDEEIADFFEVTVRTIYRWRNAHDAFCQAMTAGKDQADERVVRSLYQRAVGHKFTEHHAIKLKEHDDKGAPQERVEIVEVQRHQVPDTAAAIFWLKNRRRGEWRDKQEIDHASPDGTMTPPTTIQLVPASHDDSAD